MALRDREGISDDEPTDALDSDLVWIKVAMRTLILLATATPFNYQRHPLNFVQAPQSAGRSD